MTDELMPPAAALVERAKEGELALPDDVWLAIEATAHSIGLMTTFVRKRLRLLAEESYAAGFKESAAQGAVAVRAQAQEPLDGFAFEVAETARLLLAKGEHLDYIVRQFFTNCPGVDAHAKQHGWSTTLQVIAAGLQSSSFAPDPEKGTP